MKIFSKSSYTALLFAPLINWTKINPFVQYTNEKQIKLVPSAHTISYPPTSNVNSERGIKIKCWIKQKKSKRSNCLKILHLTVIRKLKENFISKIKIQPSTKKLAIPIQSIKAEYKMFFGRVMFLSLFRHKQRQC